MLFRQVAWLLGKIVVISVRMNSVLVMFRFMKLVDSVLPLLVPRWEYSQAAFTSLEVSSSLFAAKHVHSTFECSCLLITYLVA